MYLSMTKAPIFVAFSSDLIFRIKEVNKEYIKTVFIFPTSFFLSLSIYCILKIKANQVFLNLKKNLTK